MQQTKTRVLVSCALLVALSALLGGGVSVKSFVLGSYSLKIGFGVLPVLLAGVWFGPLWGGAVGALADFTQALLFPMGAYMPWFSVSGALFGVIPGLFFTKTAEVKPLRAFFAVTSALLVTSVGVNTFLIVTLYGNPWEIIYARMVTQAVMIPIHTVLLLALDRSTRLVKLRQR